MLEVLINTRHDWEVFKYFPITAILLGERDRVDVTVTASNHIVAFIKRKQR